MNEAKSTSQKSENIKKAKVGADGLTKKERRAQKVQAHNKQQPLLETRIDTNASLTKKSNFDDKELAIKSINTSQKNFNNIGNEENQPDKSKSDLKAAKSTVIIQETNNEKGDDPVSKSKLRATRRLLQEKQREAKAVNAPTKQKTIDKAEIKLTEVIMPLKKKEKKITTVNKHQVQLFYHLYMKTNQNADVNVNLRHIHPAFSRLGVKYSQNTVMGSNARCLALLSALIMLIKDYEAPKNEEFCRSIESSLQNCVNYLQSCRPLAVSMTNALRHFKLNLTQIDTNLAENQKKAKLIDVIETYIQDEIEKAGEAICIKVLTKITNEDIILIYGCSSLIKKILLDAHKEGKRFEVIVVDSHPLLEGREMLRCLSNLGIKCTYLLINALSFIMNKVSKILLGAHALLANGFVMSRIGTAQIALVAQAYNKPVLVCCETYKFCERVQADSFVYNEIGDPDHLISTNSSEKTSLLANWKDGNSITPLNLLYDVTPPDLVTAVVTELGFLPCTSVPVVLRIKPNEPN